MKYETINIGLLIEQRMNELGLNKSEFARRLHISSQYINRLLSKEDIDTERLKQIGEALDYDFFSHFKPVEEVNDPSITQSGDNSGASITGDVTINVQPTAEADLLKERVAALQDQIKEKQAIVEEKERLISEKQKLIDEKERTIRLLLSRTEQ